MPDSISVAPVTPDDWTSWRQLRLAALSDAPEAFGSSYETERERDEQGWRNRIAVPGTLMIATLDGEPAGIVGGYVPRESVAELISMWVAPVSRGRGVGDALVDATLSWARGELARTIELWVMRGNTLAEALYARHGFERTGAVETDPAHRCAGQLALSRPL
ncbi:MAG: GNAT family N-acetyltransferase [Jiangellaceae bacterium]